MKNRTGAFEKKYFTDTYNGNYCTRNPHYKQNAYLNQILIWKKHGKLLDIGCAYGLFLNIAQKHFTCSGIDISRHAINEARKILPATIKLKTLPIEKVNQLEKFDVITCFDVLEHVPDIDNALAELKKHLNKNAILVLSVPVYDGPLGPLVHILDKDDTHIHKQTRTFWLHLLQKQGFTIITYSGILRYGLLGKVYLHVLNTKLKSFSPAIFIIARQ